MISNTNYTFKFQAHQESTRIMSIETKSGAVQANRSSWRTSRSKANLQQKSPGLSKMSNRTNGPGKISKSAKDLSPSIPNITQPFSLKMPKENKAECTRFLLKMNMVRMKTRLNLQFWHPPGPPGAYPLPLWSVMFTKKVAN